MAFPSPNSYGLQIVSPNGGQWHWTDDSKASPICCREITIEASFIRAFYEDRPEPDENNRGPTKLSDEYLCQMLRKKLVGLSTTNRKRRLDNIDFLLGLHHVEVKSQDNWSSVRRTEFLWYIAEYVGPEHALLMKCTFSTEESIKITQYQRAKIIQFMSKNKEDLSIGDLQDIAKRVRASAKKASPPCGLQIVSPNGHRHWTDDFEPSSINRRHIAIEASLIRALYEDKLHPDENKRVPKINDSDLCQKLYDQAAELTKNNGWDANNGFRLDWDHVRKPSSPREIYMEFLWYIDKNVGPEYALLMKCTFSSNESIRITLCQRAKLIRYIHKTLAAAGQDRTKKRHGESLLSGRYPRTARETFSSKIPPQMPGQPPDLDKNGLVKFSNSEASPSWMSFFRASICPGRTILNNNEYLIIHSMEDFSVRLAIRVLACSYLKDYLVEPSQSKLVKATEKQALQMLQSRPHMSDAALMLMVHHAILNQDLHAKGWTEYFRQQQQSERMSSQILASHVIWLTALLPLQQIYPFQKLTYDWIIQTDQTSLQRVDGIVGSSRQMQYYQYKITREARQSTGRQGDHEMFLLEIEHAQQIVDEQENGDRKLIALKTALTYKFATQLYAHVRLCGRTPSDTAVKSICDELVDVLRRLPQSGPGYSSMHPAWCFLIAIACTANPKHYEEMYGILDKIGKTNKSNVSRVCMLANWIWEWKAGQQRLESRWWEDMTEHIHVKMDGDLICVS